MSQGTRGMGHVDVIWECKGDDLSGTLALTNKQWEAPRPPGKDIWFSWEGTVESVPPPSIVAPNPTLSWLGCPCFPGEGSLWFLGISVSHWDWLSEVSNERYFVLCFIRKRIPLLKEISQCFEEWGSPGSLRLWLSASAIFISSGSPMATQSFNFAKQQTGTLGIIRHVRFLSQQIKQRFTIRSSTALYLCLAPLWRALFHSRKSFEYLGPDKRMRIFR